VEKGVGEGVRSGERVRRREERMGGAVLLLLVLVLVVAAEYERGDTLLRARRRLKHDVVVVARCFEVDDCMAPVAVKLYLRCVPVLGRGW
jgi:hypothetical protein